MAGSEESTGTEPDIDAMDDTAFEALKSEVRKGAETAETEAREAAVEGEQPKPVVDAEKKPDAAEKPADGEIDEETGEKRAETVPHQQFHRERERRKAAEAERQQLADNYAVLLDRTNQLLQVQTQPQQDEQQPDPNQPPKGDPIALLEWLADRVQRSEISQQEAAQYAHQEGQRQESIRQLDNVENQFRATTPDYDEALNFAAQSRDNELQLLYPLSTPQDRQQYLLNEWTGIVNASMQARLNPAEQVYKFAAARGYKKAEPQQQEQRSAAEDIDRREETRLAAQSLGKSGGAVVNTGRPTPEQVLDMSDEEFAQFKKKHGSVAYAMRG